AALFAGGPAFGFQVSASDFELAVKALELRPSAVELHQQRHLTAQNLRNDGDWNVVDRSGLVASEGIELAGMNPCDKDDRGALEPRMLANQACRLEAVHFGH